MRMVFDHPLHHFIGVRLAFGFDKGLGQLDGHRHLSTLWHFAGQQCLFYTVEVFLFDLQLQEAGTDRLILRDKR